jgi:hypothetical protein
MPPSLPFLPTLPPSFLSSSSFLAYIPFMRSSLYPLWPPYSYGLLSCFLALSSHSPLFLPIASIPAYPSLFYLRFFLLAPTFYLLHLSTTLMLLYCYPLSLYLYYTGPSLLLLLPSPPLSFFLSFLIYFPYLRGFIAAIALHFYISSLSPFYIFIYFFFFFFFCSPFISLTPLSFSL